MIEHNLFIITSIGQLRNIQTFIAQYQATDNYAVVLYTKESYSVLQNMLDNKIYEVFDGLYYLEVPPRWGKEELNKSLHMYHDFDKMLRAMKSKYQIENLFICMPIGHYSFFEGLARKYKMSINLLEEGLATYRIFVQEGDKLRQKVEISDLKQHIVNIAYPFTVIIKYLFEIVMLPIDTMSYLCKTNLTYHAKRFLKRHLKYKYRLIEKFNHVYVFLPEKLDEHFREKNCVERLNFTVENNPWKFADVTEKNILFVNQQYIDYDIHFKVIFSIFKDMNLKKVYIKFHPKENLTVVKETIEKYLPLYPDIEIIPLMEGANIPVENLLISNNICEIIGLTSSSLFFSTLVKSNIKAFCIADEYYNRCIENGVSEKRLKTFVRDKMYIQKIFDLNNVILPTETQLARKHLSEYLSENDIKNLYS